MRLDPLRSGVAALGLGGIATGVPPDHRCGRNPVPPRRGPATHPLVSRGQGLRTQVHR